MSSTNCLRPVLVMESVTILVPVLFESYCRSHGDELVTIYGTSLVVDNGDTIDVGVEDYAHVGTCQEDGCRNGAHGLVVFRIGDVIRESSIGCKELAACGVGTERFENSFGKEAAGAVTSIHDDFEPNEGFCGIVGNIFEVGTDLLSKRVAVEGEKVEYVDFAMFGVRVGLEVGCFADNLVQLEFVDLVACGEKLHAVAVEAHVASCQHDSTIDGEPVGEGAEEHGRRG